MSSIDFKKGDLVIWRVFGDNTNFAQRCFYNIGLENLDNIGLYLNVQNENSGSVYFPELNKTLVLHNHSLKKIS